MWQVLVHQSDGFTSKAVVVLDLKLDDLKAYDVIALSTRSPLIGLGGLGQAKRRFTKIGPKAVGSGISTVFSNFDTYQLEAAGDVISGATVEWVDTDVPIKLGDSWSNCS